MAKRFKMSRGSSKRNFSKGNRVAKKNFKGPMPMRGGFRI